jgi:hypothetical protein
MNLNKIYPILCESQALEVSLATMQAENNSLKMLLSQTVVHCKDSVTIQVAEALNDDFLELESCIEHLKWELVAYNYKLKDYPSMQKGNVQQVSKTRNLLKRKIKVVKSIFDSSKQEFHNYLQLNKA